MAKFSGEEKLKVVLRYLNGNGNARTFATLPAGTSPKAGPAGVATFHYNHLSVWYSIKRFSIAYRMDDKIGQILKSDQIICHRY